MSEYKAKDFKNAKFAEHEGWGTAARTDDTKYPLWFVAKMGEPWFMEDHEMAESGWRPVVEADHPTRPLAGYRAQVKELREKVRDLERAPLTLDTLREAYETAEGPTGDNPIREGDTVIWPGGRGYTMAVANISGWPHNVRVLHRAPQPEPWQALADDLKQFDWDVTPHVAAQEMYEQGWRKTGGDES